MTVRELLEMYDNWNGITKINNDQLEMIAKGHTYDIADNIEIKDKEVVSFGFIDGEFCIRIAETECYVGDFVVYTEFGKTKITNKYNYAATIRNERQVITFDGTLDDAVEYIKQNFGGR